MVTLFPTLPVPGAPIHGRFLETGGPYPPGGHTGVDLGFQGHPVVVSPCDGWIDGITHVSDGQAFGSWVRVRIDGFPGYVALAHLHELAADLRLGAYWRAGRPVGLQGGSGAGSLTTYASHVHWGMATADNAAFVVDYARLLDPLAFYEEDDYVLSEDLLMSTYCTREELIALASGLLDRDTAIANARARMRGAMTIDEDWERGGLHFQVADHLNLPRHGGAAPINHTH